MNTQIIPVSPTLTLEQMQEIIHDDLTRRGKSDGTKRQYKNVIKRAHAADVNILDARQVSDFAASLPSGVRCFLKPAIKILVGDAILEMNSRATADNVKHIEAAERRVNAVLKSIHVEQTKGQRAHTWLNLSEVRALLTNLTDVTTTKGLRDRVVLGLLLGAGLRRDELVSLTWDEIKTQGERVVLSITGKGNKERVIPISEALHSLLGKWGDEIDPEGYVCRSVSKGGKVGTSMSGQAVLDIVDAYGQELGKEKLRPHDLRRTYARIGYDSGVDIGQISKLLGHASIATTQRYLGLDVDLKKTISDFIPFQ